MLKLVLARVGRFVLVAADADVGVASTRFLREPQRRVREAGLGINVEVFECLGRREEESGAVIAYLRSGFGDKGVRGQAFLRVG